MSEQIEVPQSMMEMARRRTKKDALHMVHFDRPLTEAMAFAYVLGFIDCAKTVEVEESAEV